MADLMPLLKKGHSVIIRVEVEVFEEDFHPDKQEVSTRDAAETAWERLADWYSHGYQPIVTVESLDGSVVVDLEDVPEKA